MTTLNLSGTRFKRSKAVRYVQVLKANGEGSWSAYASATGIPASTLRRWVAESESQPQGGLLRRSLKTIAFTLGLLLVTLILLLGMQVGICYLFGGSEEAKFIFNFWLREIGVHYVY